jgi:hypothetical protein
MSDGTSASKADDKTTNDKADPKSGGENKSNPGTGGNPTPDSGDLTTYDA